MRSATTVRAGRGGGGGAAVVSAPHVAHDCDRVTACLGDTSRHSPTARGGAQRRTQRGDNGPETRAAAEC